MSEKIVDYKTGVVEDFPEENIVMPLYGKGFENLGKDGMPIQVNFPEYGPDELLVRHDAVGLCFSDIKIIKQGEEHARIYRTMADNPVVMGHEVTMTIVGIGENLKDEYKLGDRFIMQSDIYVNGIGYAYGYEIQGGMSLFNVIDKRILEGDGGNYLIPVQPDTGYAESALTEPWACVIAAYGLSYRSGLKPDGIAWVIGTPAAEKESYTIGAGFDADAHPSKLLMTNVPETFASWLKAQAAELGIEVVEVADVANPPEEKIDDIIVLGADADTVETVSPHLAKFGILAVIAEKPFERRVNVDIGSVHYERWVYVGGGDEDVAKAYSDVPVRSELHPEGRAWFVGAGGAMGRMHVQRAIEMENGPKTIVCTEVSDLRLQDLMDSFGADAEERGVELICLNVRADNYKDAMAEFKASGGFDDIIVMAPVPPVIADAATYVAPQGVMNVFAGVVRGTTIELDLSEVYSKNVRWIGHSGSSIEDLTTMLHSAESGKLSPNRAVAAVGSLNALRDGLQAVHDATFPGKVVIFPHIKELPLTPIWELKEKMPTVYAKLKNGREWTPEAEEEFLTLMLQ